MKRIFTLLLATMLVGQAWAYDFSYGDLNYNIISDSTVEVTYQERSNTDNYGWLTTASIPETVNYNGKDYVVTSIGRWAFSGCRGLTSLSLPNSIVNVDQNAFDYCNNLQYNEYDNAYYLGNIENPYICLIKAKSANISSCEINTDCKIIGGNAFNGCNNLTSISIPKSVVNIGLQAFQGSILTNIIVDIDNKNYSSEEGVLFDNDKTTLICYPAGKVGEYVIPNTVTNIGAYAFYYCKNLTDIDIPYSVHNIGSYAFSGCNSLLSVNIPSSITNIESYTFNACSGLTSITIPNSVTNIGSFAFKNCSGLTSLIIPNSVVIINSSILQGCYSLQSISLPFVGNKPHKISDTYQYPFGYIFGTNSYTGAIATSQSYYTSANNVTRSTYYIPTSLKEIIITGDSPIPYGAFEDCKNIQYLSIPNSITYIGANAFLGCYNLSYNEYDNAYYVGNEDNPFLVLIKSKNNGITTCIINNNCKFIYKDAFSGCNNLTSINIPNSIISIGNNAFLNCSGLTSITIPSGITDIRENSYSGCSSLTSVTIPNSVRNIESGAFIGCSGLISVDIPSSVTKIGSDAFKNVKNVAYSGNATGSPWGAISVNGTIEGDFIYSDAEKTQLIIYIGNSDEVGIPNTVSNIGANAFSDCIYLKSISIPNSVTSIGKYAFKNCSVLTSVIVPKTVTSIGYGAFAGCTSIESITLPFVGDKPHIATDTYQYPFGYIFGESDYGRCEKTTQVYYGNSTSSTRSDTYYIPTSLKEVILTGSGYIPYGAFYNCKNITYVSIPKSITKIGNNAFYNCNGLVKAEFASIADLCGIQFYSKTANPLSCAHHLFINGEEVTNLIIPDSVTSIGSYAFNECNALTAVIIPNSVTKINCSFNGCSALSSIVIPNSVTNIVASAFSGCSGLSSITLPFVGNQLRTATDKYQYPLGYIFGTNNYTGGAITTQYYYGNSTYSTTKETYYIPTNLKEVIITNSNYIPYGAFYNCSHLDSVYIPKSVKEIGKNAFYGCKKLATITIPDSVTNIADETFYGCGSLTSVSIGSSISTIGNSAFYGCSSLTSAIIPNSVTHIGDYAFNDCNSLTTVVIPNSVTHIGQYAFSGCNKLSSLIIPNSVSSVGINAFSNSGLTSIVIPNSIKSISDDAFNGCENLETVTIQDSIISIGNDAFKGCNGLTSINIPSSITKIGQNAFSDCGNLSTITIPSTVYEIGSSAFYDCVNLTIYCQGKVKASGWHNDWNISNCPVVWGAQLAVIIVRANNAAYGNVVGSGEYAIGTTVPLMAAANTGYKFAGWSDGSSDNPHTVAVVLNTTYTANFTPIGETINTDTTSHHSDTIYIVQRDTIYNIISKTDTIFISSSDTIYSIVNNYDTIYSTQIDTVYSVITKVDTVYNVINKVDTVYNIVNNYDTIYSTQIDTVYSVITKVDTVYNVINKIDTVYNIVNNYDTIYSTQIDTVYSVITKIDTVYNVINKIDTVYDIVNNYDTIYSTQIDTVYSVITKVDTVYNVINKVDTIYNIVNNYDTIYSTQIDTVYSVITKVDTIYNVINKVDTVFSIINTRDTVFSFASRIDTVYSVINKIDTIYCIVNNTDTIYNFINRIDTVYSVVNNYDTVLISQTDTVYNVINKVDTVYSVVNNRDTVFVSRTDTIYNYISRIDTVYSVIVTSDTIWLSPTVPCYLNILSNNIAMGIVDGGGKFEIGAEVSISAIPKAGFRFTQWSDGNLSASRTIILENDVLLMAYFEPIMYTITSRSANVNMGIAYGSGNYAENSTIEIAALPNYGYHFVCWNDGETSNPRKITVTYNKTFTAVFEVNNYELMAAANEEAMGKVTGADSYAYLSRPQIRAYANAGYKFAGWSDGETANPREVLVYSDTLFVALFELENDGHRPIGPVTDPVSAVINQINSIFNMIYDLTDVEEETANEVNIYAYDNKIVVENAETTNGEIEVFDINGRMVAKTTANSNRIEIPMKAEGVYIVRVGFNAKRVVVN